MDEIASLLEPQIPGLRRYAWALLRDCEAADDLVQDTLERAISRWNQRREGDLRAWLFAIRRNLFINGLRQRKVTVAELARVADILPSRRLSAALDMWST